jgi:hypothetical protein
MRPNINVGDAVCYARHSSTLRAAWEWYLGLGDSTRKSAAKREHERLAARRGTVLELTEPRPSTTAWGIRVLWDDGSTSHGWASEVERVSSETAQPKTKRCHVKTCPARWTCRTCGALCCKHYCTAKSPDPDRVATCGSCKLASAQWGAR